MQNNTLNLRQIIYGKYFFFEHFDVVFFSLFFGWRVKSLCLKCDNLLCNSLPKLSLISVRLILCHSVCVCVVAPQLLCFSRVRVIFVIIITTFNSTWDDKQMTATKKHSFFIFVDGKFIIRFCLSLCVCCAFVRYFSDTGMLAGEGTENLKCSCAVTITITTIKPSFLPFMKPQSCPSKNY